MDGGHEDSCCHDQQVEEGEGSCDPHGGTKAPVNTLVDRKRIQNGVQTSMSLLLFFSPPLSRIGGIYETLPHNPAVAGLYSVTQTDVQIKVQPG